MRGQYTSSVSQCLRVCLNSSDKKLKRDGKPKKAKEEDHLKQIPFRLREIMKSKEMMKTAPPRSKKLKEGKLRETHQPSFFYSWGHDFVLYTKVRDSLFCRLAISLKVKPEDSQDGDIPVPHFKRGRHETERAYLRRMENATKHVLFLTKNQVDRKPELAADQQERPADKGKSEKKKEYDKGRLQRLQLKKLNRQEAELEKEMYVDHVPFGEVAMAPPCFSSKPKKAPVKSQVSKGLLLNSLLGNTMASTTKPSMARQRIMEEERVRAVEAYRHLKKQKQQQHEARTAGLEKLKSFQ
uniref:Coiled-coil domain-containing protein 137 n=1 Tax=Scophthalmus maximus TaxID=52904 RepID=A0A8D3DU49_SCOMX